MRPTRKGSHTVYDLRVHLVWSTKYRYKVLQNKIGYRIRELIRQKCKSLDIQIIRGRVSQNHVHMYISYPPKLSISDIVRLLKGNSSRKIQQEFPELNQRYWGRHFWGIGYGAFSAGHVTDEMIKNYLDNHSDQDDDDFVVE